MNAKKKKRLGRGLDALLSSSEPVAKQSSAASDATNTLPIEVLQPGQYQPRTNMDQASLEELAASIKSQGIIQPILVRPVGAEQYEIIAGERRWRAAQLAQLDEVPVLVRNIPDEATLAVALIENIQRENLNPIEEAVGLRRLMDEFDLTHEEMAKSVGRSRTSVTNLLRLLNLSQGARELLEHGRIEMGHARALLGLPVEQQTVAAQQISDKNLSVRQAEALVRSLVAPAKHKQPVKKSTDILRLEEDLSEQLATNVSIIDSKGKGRLVIEYKNLDVLEGILAHIK